MRRVELVEAIVILELERPGFGDLLEDEVDEVCRQILDFPHSGARAPLLPPELEVRVYLSSQAPRRDRLGRRLDRRPPSGALARSLALERGRAPRGSTSPPPRRRRPRCSTGHRGRAQAGSTAASFALRRATEEASQRSQAEVDQRQLTWRSLSLRRDEHVVGPEIAMHEAQRPLRG